MGEAKIEARVGGIEFCGEGEQEWLAAQFDKIVATAESMAMTPPPLRSVGELGEPSELEQTAEDEGVASKTLPGFLAETDAQKVQVRKFLATAVWLGARGKYRLQTADIAKALKEANQSRLSNPADCLNKNVAKGYCEKDGNGFFVTQEGKESRLK